MAHYMAIRVKCSITIINAPYGEGEVSLSNSAHFSIFNFHFLCVLFICFHCRVPSGRSFLMSEYHGTAPSACTVFLVYLHREIMSNFAK